MCCRDEKYAIHSFNQEFYRARSQYGYNRSKKETIRIAYDVNKKIANKAKNYSESKSYKELGEITFDYYVQMEELGDE